MVNDAAASATSRTASIPRIDKCLLGDLLRCKSSGGDKVFTVGESHFHAENGDWNTLSRMLR